MTWLAGLPLEPEVARASEARAGSEARALLEQFPAGARVYLELEDPGGALDELLASAPMARLKQGPEVARFWASPHALPLRLALGALEGVSGLDRFQIQRAFEGARVALAEYPPEDAGDDARFLLMITGPSPLLERLLRGIAPLAGAEPGSARLEGAPALAAKRFTLQRRGRIWIATNDPALAPRHSTARGGGAGLAVLRGLRELRAQGSGHVERRAWLWLAPEAADRGGALLRWLGTLFPLPSGVEGELRERLAAAPWVGAELHMDLDARPLADARPPTAAAFARLSLRLVLPLADAAPGPHVRLRVPGARLGEALRARLDAEPELGEAEVGSRPGADSRIALALAIADLAERLELTRGGDTWTEVELAVRFAPPHAGTPIPPGAGSAEDGMP